MGKYKKQHRINLETERLVLRPFQNDDLSDSFEYLSDSDVVEFLPYGVKSWEEAKEDLADKIDLDDYIAVQEKSSGKLIGHIYISKRYCNSYELGFVFNKNFWGKSYAYEAAVAVCRDVFQRGAHRIEGNCDPNNVRSWKLLERLGFVREGHLHSDVFFRKDENGNPIWRDTFVYSLLCDNFKC